jgi:hypothetical protein
MAGIGLRLAKKKRRRWISISHRPPPILIASLRAAGGEFIDENAG